MQREGLHIVLIFVAAVTIFFVSNHFLEGYLRSPVYLGKELKSPADSLYEYRLSTEAPFKYRLAFPAIVKSTYELFSDGQNAHTFYVAYKFWSAFFFVLCSVLLYYLLTSLSFSPRYALAGTFVFLILPPMLMAFSLPVHTREDTLAYAILFSGLNVMVRGKYLLFLLIAIVGALTRETLLLLPLLYFFFQRDPNLLRRFVIAGIPGLVWLSVRVFSPHEEYDMWEGLKWNLANPEQVVGFLFITFNVCWLSFALSLLAYYKQGRGSVNEKVSFFYRSALFTLAVILVTTFVGGIYNEIRLLYLFFPWIIVLSLDFVRLNIDVIRSALAMRSFKAYAIGAFVVCAALLYFVVSYRTHLITPGKWAVPYEQWIIASVAYIFLMLLFLPVTFRVLGFKNSIK